MPPEQVPSIAPPSLVRSGALTIAWALVGMWLSGLGSIYLMVKVRADLDRFSDFEIWFAVTHGLNLCLGLVLFWGIGSLGVGAWRKAANARARVLLAGVGGVAALLLIDSNLYHLQILLGRDPDWGMARHDSWILYASSLLYLLQWSGLLAVLHGQGRSDDERTNALFRIKSALAAFGIVLVSLRTALFLFWPKTSVSSEPGIAYYLLRIIPGLLLFLPLAWIALSVATKHRSENPHSENMASPEWATCARGLGVYANALTWKLLILVATSLAFLVAAFGEHKGLLSALQTVPPLVMLVVSVCMVWGLKSAAEQPYDSPARAPATLAFVLALLGLLLELYMAFLSFRLQSAAESGSMRYGAMMDMQERIVQLSKYSTYLGLSAVAALVLSLRSLFLHWGQHALARRTLLTALGLATTLLIFLVLRRDGVDRGSYGIQRAIGYASLALTIALATVLSLRSLARAAARMIGTTPKLAAAIVHKDDEGPG